MALLNRNNFTLQFHLYLKIYQLKISASQVIHHFSIARHIQKHQRIVSVIETMDNGKPIRESRDADVPTVVRHWYHHAGWAQLMDTEMKGWKPVGKRSCIKIDSRLNSKCINW